MSDADLIRRVRKGENAAYDLLVEQYQESIFRFAYLLLGDPDEAKDVAQETFIRAFRAVHRFDESRPFRPWLMQIAANLARNHYRSLSRYRAVLQRMADVVSDHAAASANTLPEGESEALWQAIRKLSEADRTIVYLRYFLDMSEAETAETLRIAPGTVKSRLHRALGKLRAILASEEGGRP